MSDATVTYTNHEITVTINGYTHRHKKAAQVGDMWKHKYDHRLVVVCEIDDFYVKAFNTDDNGNFYDWHKSSFYASFESLED